MKSLLLLFLLLVGCASVRRPEVAGTYRAIEPSSKGLLSYLELQTSGQARLHSEFPKDREESGADLAEWGPWIVEEDGRWTLDGSRLTVEFEKGKVVVFALHYFSDGIVLIEKPKAERRFLKVPQRPNKLPETTPTAAKSAGSTPTSRPSTAPDR